MFTSKGLHQRDSHRVGYYGDDKCILDEVKTVLQDVSGRSETRDTVTCVCVSVWGVASDFEMTITLV